MKMTESVLLHDKYQFEMKFTCPVDSRRKDNDYHVDVFFFLPRNLGVNAENYGSREFYNDFSEYIRFKTPAVALSALAEADNPTLAKLETAIAGLPGNEADFFECLKMYCSIVKSALRDGEIGLEAIADSAELEAAAKSYLKNTELLLHNYRKLGAKIRIFPKALELFTLVDEFLSITANRYQFQLNNALAARPDTADKSKWLEHIAVAARREIEYRKARNYPSVPLADGDNSELLYRESTLKKAMAGILFLNVQTRRAGVLLENMLLGFAAAVAMIFVTAIAFLWKGLFLEEFSFSFFVVWVIAYIFKDRIKSLLQLYFVSNRSRYSYDFRQSIKDGLGHVVGICREGFRYRADAELEPDIRLLRNRTTLNRLENGSLSENILVYRKLIELKGRGCKDIFRAFDVNSVVNIIRINVRNWTVKMDNPTRPIYTVDDRKRIVPVKAHRDYHVNMVIRYGARREPEQYIRYRLVMCRSGIRRIERFEK